MASLAVADVLLENRNFSVKLVGKVSGFRTGSVDKVLEKIAVGYDEEVDEKMSNLISVLEPTLVIILSVVVCLILLSVMLPLMGVMGSIG